MTAALSNFKWIAQMHRQWLLPGSSGSSGSSSNGWMRKRDIDKVDARSSHADRRRWWRTVEMSTFHRDTRSQPLTSPPVNDRVQRHSGTAIRLSAWDLVVAAASHAICNLQNGRQCRIIRQTAPPPAKHPLLTDFAAIPHLRRQTT